MGVIFIPRFSQKIVYLENQLTPYSVSVNGYHRKDGTYANSYNRRPPGSLDRDIRIQSDIQKNKNTRTIVILSIITSLGFFGWRSKRYFFRLRNEYETYLFKLILLEFEPQLISELKFTYSKILKGKLYYRWSFDDRNIKCSRCSEFIPLRGFMLTYRRQEICQKCLEKRSFDSISEVLYWMNKFRKEFHEIESKFLKVNITMFPNYQLDIDKFENHLHDEISRTV